MPEIGRISGPLLKENLTRDGVNLRFENNLIYLDVNTHASDVLASADPLTWTGNVGIRNPNPAYPLDVQGTARSNVLLVKPNASYDAYAEIDDIKLDGRTISTTVGSLEIRAATGTDRVNINSNTKIDANLEVTGNITLGGTINIGNEPTDDIVFGGEVKSNIIPDATSTYDIGSLLKTWRAGYFDDVIVDGLSVGNITVEGSFINDQIEITGNTIRTFRSNADLELDTAGTGQVIVLGQAGFIVPVGTTLERPIPARTGTIRLNTDTQRLENYNGVAWNRVLHDDDAIAFAIALG